METAKAARAPPKMSSGIVYTLTLTAETARMLSEIPAAVQPGVGSSGISAVGKASSAPARQTRVRVTTAGTPVRIQSSDSQPPPKPPSAATSGGTTAYQLASTSARRCVSTGYSVVQFVHIEYTLMLSAFAATRVHNCGDRKRSRVLGAGSWVLGKPLPDGRGSAARAVRFHSGIQISPSVPVTTKACRHP